MILETPAGNPNDLFPTPGVEVLPETYAKVLVDGVTYTYNPEESFWYPPSGIHPIQDDLMDNLDWTPVATLVITEVV